MRISKVLITAALLWGMSAGAATPTAKTFTCGTCHQAQAASSPATPMGIGMELPPNQKTLKLHPKLTAEFRGFKYTVERKGDVSVYTVTKGTGSISLPIEYAFGVHMQTYVFLYQGRYFESMVSYYTTTDNLDVTLGDEGLEPKTLIEALGKEYSEAAISRCFGCHSSGSVKAAKLHLDTLRPGLDCEHCHTGATAHMEALAKGKDGVIPERLGKRASEEMSEYCGVCHRTWESAVRSRVLGPANVRFQPYRLSLSKCFRGNDQRISCTACHNPHDELVRNNPKFYDSKCLACHITKSNANVVVASATAASSKQKPCPVSTENCTSCHMRKVELPGGHTIFNDHFIRVLRDSEEYPN